MTMKSRVLWAAPVRRVCGVVGLSLVLGLSVSVAVAADAVALFDGESLRGWVKGDGKPAVLGEGWVVDEGCLHRQSGGGDLLTEKDYGDFELEFEWKIAKGANSGVKYRVGRFNGALLGMEYQVLDDEGHSNGRKDKTSAASFYDVLAPDDAKELKPIGEFNHSRIVAKGTKFEHWLNGRKVLEFDAASEAFREAKEASKFRAVEEFGLRPTGRILLQDHGDPVWFRNIRITELSE